MYPYKADEHITHYKLNYHHQPITVSFDVKHEMLIPHGIYTSKIGFHIGKTVPVGRLRYFIPPLQSNFRVFPSRRLVKLSQFPM